jgi:glycosyltransferase involved in cell wall biosynthesis
LGYISDFDLISELQKADLFVLPSLQESFGIATLEALACNIPVVVTKTGIFNEIIKHKAGEVVENTHQSLKQGIITALLKNYGNNPRNLALQYSWKKCANLIIRLHEQNNNNI